MSALFRESSVQETLKKYSKQPVDTLKIASALSKLWNPQERLWISEWIALAPKITEKFAVNTTLLCDRLALEQSTARDIGTWKSKLWPANSRMLDLCCGMGGDSLFLPESISVTGIDLDPFRCEMYAINTQQVGTSRNAVLANALDAPIKADFFQIDPARRTKIGDNQRKSMEMTPSIAEIMTILPQFHGAMLKLPPGFPVDELPPNSSRIYIGSHNDCRECLVLLGSLATQNTGEISAVCMPNGEMISASFEQVETTKLPSQPLGKFLIEPNPTLVRSHLFPIWARDHGMWQIDSQIAYLSCDVVPPASPWFSSFRVIDSCTLNTGKVKQMFKLHGIKPTTLKKRGIEVDPVEELRKLKPESGIPGTLFYTRIQNEKMAILTLPQRIE